VSPSGRTVALLVGAAAIALWFGPWAAALAMGVVVAAFAVDAWSIRGGPSVVRAVPGEVVRGQPTPFSVRVEPWAARRVAVRQPQTADLRFEPAEGIGDLAGQVVATRRGRHEVGPCVTRTWGPLRLARWTHRHGEPLTVASHPDLPAARRIATAVRQGRFRDPGLRRGPLGLGTDFESIRDYTPDDDIRRVNWLASERTGRPMVNQFREDTERDLWCFVDTGRLLSSPVGDRTRLDATLDALAAVAAVADAVGDHVGAVVFDDHVRQVVRPRRAGAAALVRLLDDLEPRVVDSDYEAAFARVTAKKRSLVLVFTDLLDAAAAAPLLDAVPVLARHHAVVIAGVADPDLVAAVTTPPTRVRDLHVAAVATDLVEERDAVRARLTHAGALVVDAPADHLPTRCVSAYLRLKSAARL
jgi:uncharacterized protein (DUF58 family)